MGSNLSAIYPETGAIVILFHPRNDKWEQHFKENGSLIEGLTQTGRATIELLKMNAQDRRDLRSVVQG
jgi:hypothetical protein